MPEQIVGVGRPRKTRTQKRRVDRTLVDAVEEGRGLFESSADRVAVGTAELL